MSATFHLQAYMRKTLGSNLAWVDLREFKDRDAAFIEYAFQDGLPGLRLPRRVVDNAGNVLVENDAARMLADAQARNRARVATRLAKPADAHASFNLEVLAQANKFHVTVPTWSGQGVEGARYETTEVATLADALRVRDEHVAAGRRPVVYAHAPSGRSIVVDAEALIRAGHGSPADHERVY